MEGTGGDWREGKGEKRRGERGKRGRVDGGGRGGRKVRDEGKGKKTVERGAGPPT